MSRMLVVKQAIGLGSIALGVAALMAPRRFADAVGVADAAPPEAIAAFGSRELAAGAALLSPVKFGPFLWLRVGGDALDLIALAAAAKKPESNKKLLVMASIAVVAITVFDVVMALQDANDPD